MRMRGEKLRIETGSKLTEVKAGIKMMRKRVALSAVVVAVRHRR